MMTPIPELALSIGFGLLLGWNLILTVRSIHQQRSLKITDTWCNAHATGLSGPHGVTKLHQQGVRNEISSLHKLIKKLDKKNRRRDRDDVAVTLRLVAESLQNQARDINALDLNPEPKQPKREATQR